MHIPEKDELFSAHCFLNIIVAVSQFYGLFEIIQVDGPQNALLNVYVSYAKFQNLDASVTIALCPIVIMLSQTWTKLPIHGDSSGKKRVFSSNLRKMNLLVRSPDQLIVVDRGLEVIGD